MRQVSHEKQGNIVAFIILSTAGREVELGTIVERVLEAWTKFGAPVGAGGEAD